MSITELAAFIAMQQRAAYRRSTTRYERKQIKRQKQLDRQHKFQANLDRFEAHCNKITSAMMEKRAAKKLARKERCGRK